VGIDSLGMDAARCARALDALAPDFEAGLLRAFPVARGIPLAAARGAYEAALAGARERVVLVP
jgi:hypothetical protein